MCHRLLGLSLHSPHGQLKLYPIGLPLAFCCFFWLCARAACEFPDALNAAIGRGIHTIHIWIKEVDGRERGEGREGGRYGGVEGLREGVGQGVI